MAAQKAVLVGLMLVTAEVLAALDGQSPAPRVPLASKVSEAVALVVIQALEEQAEGLLDVVQQVRLALAAAQVVVMRRVAGVFPPHTVLALVVVLDFLVQEPMVRQV